MPAAPVFGLEVPAGDSLTVASGNIPLSYRITMAAVDPNEPPMPGPDDKVSATARSTLRIIRVPVDEESDDEDSDDDDGFRAFLERGDESDDDSNGGPSDLGKAKQKKQEAALRKLMEAAQAEEDSDEEMEDIKPKGKGKGKASQQSKKGKEKAAPIEEDKDDDDESDDCGDDCDSDDDEAPLEQFVLCTLDNEKSYQQPLDITVGRHEKVFFAVTGSLSVFLTGNYILPSEDSDSEDDEDYDDDEDYPLGPDDLDEDSDEEDDLDDLEDPRIVEIESEEEVEAPKLVEAKGKKGKKRPAEDDADALDELIAKEAKTAEPKLTKKQQKKLKNNQGEAVAAEAKTPQTPKDSAKSDKKVQFAKQLEQGPTGSAEKNKQAEKPKVQAQQAVKEKNGLLMDDRTLGTGRMVKPGDKVSVRYIGRLMNGNVFDANKKGKPFTFTVGKGEVIKGWDEGLVGMAPGGERRLTVPAKMAYGNRRMGEIPANSTLKFDIKLLEIK